MQGLPRTRVADHRQVDQQAAQVARLQRHGRRTGLADVAAPARTAGVPVVNAHDPAVGEEHALDQRLAQRTILQAIALEQRALLQVETGQAQQSAALEREIDAPAVAVLVHHLHGGVAELAPAVEDLVRRKERLQHPRPHVLRIDRRRINGRRTSGSRRGRNAGLCACGADRQRQQRTGRDGRESAHARGNPCGISCFAAGRFAAGCIAAGCLAMARPAAGGRNLAAAE